MTPTLHPTEKTLIAVSDWRRTPGDLVEVRSAERVLRRGAVDGVMPDGTGLWLAADGVEPRTYIHKDEHLELWTEDVSEGQK